MSPSQQPRRKSPPPTLGQSGTKPWVRVVIVLIVVVLGLGSIAAIFFKSDDDSSTDVSTATSAPTAPPNTTPALASAAGKPCVAVADPLPAGAPEVAVAVGPPPTELVIKDLTVGTGETVEASSTVTVDYIGVACSTGKIFDTSYGQQPVSFPLNSVIPGWTQGLAGMKAGGSRLLGIPAELAYGANGSPPDIAPDEALWFVVDVKDVEPTVG